VSLKKYTRGGGEGGRGVILYLNFTKGWTTGEKHKTTQTKNRNKKGGGQKKKRGDGAHSDGNGTFAR